MCVAVNVTTTDTYLLSLNVPVLSCRVAMLAASLLLRLPGMVFDLWFRGVCSSIEPHKTCMAREKIKVLVILACLSQMMAQVLPATMI